ncbi:MAG TPA: polysaccharide deacetylase family protein [Verrucomicrobiae bacterium]|nr:polysaccharide deacetylase family protein [Verrucomicrobiae bacterium]
MKKLALQFLRNCGVFDAARTLSSGMARVLMYHNFSCSAELWGDSVSVHQARTQLAYLRRHFHIVSLSTLVEQLGGDVPFEDRMVVLTVDDGRRNFYEYLFPLLKEFAIPATFFVVTSFIRGEDWIWTDKVQWLGEQPNPLEELSPDNIGRLFETLNRMRPAARDVQISELAERMHVSIPGAPPAKYAACSWPELREMVESRLVEIGSHTVTHPILSGLTEEESRWELVESRAEIENTLGCKVQSFCFPNGKPADYRPTHLQQVRDAGYASAVVAGFGMAAKSTNAYELPRIGIAGSSDLLSFSKNVDGVEYYQSKIRSGLGFRSVRD